MSTTEAADLARTILTDSEDEHPADLYTLNVREARTLAHAAIDGSEFTESVFRLHRKSYEPRLVGFPRANREEHYCVSDQRPWPCPTAALNGETA